MVSALDLCLRNCLPGESHPQCIILTQPATALPTAPSAPSHHMNRCGPDRSATALKTA
ncbi:hypothetical protein IG631_06356 [Alternaria alternata]|nr:hypothetical protein IG631_06356 [Alternaria alternata]